MTTMTPEGYPVTNPAPLAQQPPQPAPTPQQPQVQYENYWGTSEEFTYTLPDGHQFFVIKPLDEGGKVMFQKMTNKGIRVNQRTQDAHLDIDPASERHELIKRSVIHYNLMVPVFSGGVLVEWTQHPYSTRGLTQWLEKANPKTVQDLEEYIRKNNPWMEESMTAEQIEEQIDRLVEMKKRAEERESGEDGSANK